MRHNFIRRLRKRTVIIAVAICLLLIAAVITVFLWQNGIVFNNDFSSEIIGDETKKFGNTSGNINNSGMFAQDGEWVYYQNGNDEDKLYRMKVDGSENTKICDDEPYNINVLDGWVYYTSFSEDRKLCKIRTNGEDKCYLDSYDISLVNVFDGWIYYTASFGKQYNTIWKCRLDGSERTLLTYERSFCLTTDGEWLYYVTFGDDSNDDNADKNVIYRMNVDGENKQRLGQGKSINVEDGYIYFGNLEDDYKLYRMRADGSEKEKLCDDQAENINVTNGWVYYCDYGKDMQAFRIRVDGSERKILLEEPSWGFNVVGDYVYFLIKSDPNKIFDLGEFYRMKLDGTELEKL